MPALKLVSCGKESKYALTSRPFAGDDLHVLCVLQGIYRLLQVICITPFWVKLFLFRLEGGDLIGLSGEPSWCVDSLESTSFQVDDFSDLLVDDGVLEKIGDSEAVIIPFTTFLSLSILYTFFDLILAMSTWSAASVGTPTDPIGEDTKLNREKLLRTLIWIKITFMNLLLMCTFSIGVVVVVFGRKYNYGCGADNRDGIDIFEGSPWYIMFSITMVTYGFEILFWPCILLNQIFKAIVSTSRERSIMNVWNFLSKSPHTFQKDPSNQHRQTAQCLGDCLKCIQCISCNSLQGGKIRAEVDLSDAAVAIMDFFNVETSFDIVLSDIYIVFQILVRLRGERAFKASHQSRLDGTRLLKDMRPDDASAHPTKLMLQHDSSADLITIRDAARYSKYALGIYDHYQPFLKKTGRLSEDSTEVYNPNASIAGEAANVTLSSCVRLGELECPNTVLVYGSFRNEKVSTPYCILVDDDVKKVVVAVRGTASLEDLVTDLQITPVNMLEVGNTCGFDGKNKYAHRGILERAKFLFNDLMKTKILRKLLPPQNRNDKEKRGLQGYSLVLTGHSLGAACVVMLSTMLKPMYPDVKCYAYCPPGCSTSIDYAEECKNYVVSIVCGNDIIPRVAVTNFEIMRYEFFETLARIRCSKYKVIREMRSPCRDEDLESQMKRLLYDKDKIPTHTAYHQQLQAFRTVRLRECEDRFPLNTRLTIPGRIIHLVRCMDKDGTFKNAKYVPYYEQQDSFKELTLNLQAVLEHSLDSLVVHLEQIARAYEAVATGVVEPESLYASFTCSQHSYEDFANEEGTKAAEVHDEGWFLFCSMPHGSISLMPALLAGVATVISIVANNSCNIFIRNVESELYFGSSETTLEQVTAVSFGLYNYGFEYYSAGSDSLKRQCSLHPPQTQPDLFIKLARGFAGMALIIALPVLGFLTVASCMKLKERSFARLSFALFVAACCESLIFLFMKSDACHMNPEQLSHNLVLDNCSLNKGSRLPIVAAILWLSASVVTATLSNSIPLHAVPNSFESESDKARQQSF